MEHITYEIKSFDNLTLKSRYYKYQEKNPELVKYKQSDEIINNIVIYFSYQFSIDRAIINLCYYNYIYNYILIYKE